MKEQLKYYIEKLEYTVEQYQVWIETYDVNDFEDLTEEQREYFEDEDDFQLTKEANSLENYYGKEEAYGQVLGILKSILNENE